MIKGKFRCRTFTDKNDVTRTVIDIVANTVGHDMNRGVANYLRQQRAAAIEGDPVAETPQDMADDRELPEDRDMIDEEAIEQFGRELDGLGGAEVATQAPEGGRGGRRYRVSTVRALLRAKTQITPRTGLLYPSRAPHGAATARIVA